MKKIIIYSANIGNYDSFKEPKIFDENIEYFLFTDTVDLKIKIWKICNINFLDKNLDNARITRFIKLNPHKVLPSHDISIWVDHCFNPKILNVTRFIEEINFKDQIACYKHDERNCIYQEAKVVIERELDKKDVVEKQILKYKREEFPENYGLYQCGFMIRGNNCKINKFNEFWWNEVKNHSARDQISQVYSAWKNDIKIEKISVGNSVYDNNFLEKKIKHNILKRKIKNEY